MGAVLATKKVSSVMKPGSHGSTFGGNPLVMAAANAVLDVITEKEFLHNLSVKIDFLTIELQKMQSEFPKFISEIRGQGFLRGIKLNYPVDEVQVELKKNKILFVAAAENVLRILPPLTVKLDEIALAISVLKNVAKKRLNK